MKHTLKFNYLPILLALFTMGFLSSCGDDDTPDDVIDSMSFDLEKRSDNGGDGTVKFEKISDTETRIVIELDRDESGVASPAHIHQNSAAEGGDIYVSLESVINGMSTTLITAADNGNSLTYEDLIAYDGYVNVHESADNLGVLLAQGDIGDNVLTGEEKEYELAARNDSGVSGKVTIKERKSGAALAVVELNGTTDGGFHPAHIHANSFAEGGGIVLTLNDIDGSTGLSMTHIEETDDGTQMLYDDILSVDGYVNVHLSTGDLSVVSQGDIGSNELTGENKKYDLDALTGFNVSGNVTFSERKNGNTLVEIDLNNTIPNSTHPAHIHAGSVANSPGSIVISLNAVNGDTGLSYTNIEARDDASLVNYTQLTNIDGYVNIHLSPQSVQTIVAQGDVGINAE